MERCPDSILPGSLVTSGLSSNPATEHPVRAPPHAESADLPIADHASPIPGDPVPFHPVRMNLGLAHLRDVPIRRITTWKA